MRRPLALLLVWAAAGSACRNIGEPGPPRLAVTPPALAFTGLAGGVGPPGQALTVDAIGVGRLTWTARADVPWLAVVPTSDTAPALAQVTVLVAGLGPGAHTGTVTVATTSGLSRQIAVPTTLTLTSVASLTGRWAGATTTVTLTLALSQRDSTVAGSGTLRPPFTSVRVAGFVRGASVALTLQAPDSTVTTFAGSLVDENTISGVLNGGSLANYALTVSRQ